MILFFLTDLQSLVLIIILRHVYYMRGYSLYTMTTCLFICRRHRDKKEEVAEPEADPERDQRTVFAYQVGFLPCWFISTKLFQCSCFYSKFDEV